MIRDRLLPRSPSRFHGKLEPLHHAATTGKLDKEHKIVQKVGDGLKTVGAKAQDLDKKHDISGKVATGITGMMNGITKSLNKPSDK